MSSIRPRFVAAIASLALVPLLFAGATIAHAQQIAWTAQLGGPDQEVPVHAAVDDLGDVVVIGNHVGPVDLDPGPDEFILEPYFRGVFVVKLDAAGRFAWAVQLSGGIV